MDAKPKYDDGRYHVEPCDVGWWKIVNIYGDVCFNGKGELTFPFWFDADEVCQRLNDGDNGGAVMCNLE